MRTLKILASMFALCPLVRADLLCHGTNTPQALVNWNSPIMLPRFDPALGTLNFVDVCVTGWLSGTYSLESLESIATTWQGQPAVVVSLLRPDQSVILLAIPLVNIVDNLTPFDGVIDFAGTSGIMHTGLSATTTTQLNLTSAADLALFTGAAGNPGSVTLPVVATGSSVVTGPGHCISQFTIQAQGMISICYDYTPVAAPFCFGDGQGPVACPCGNSSLVGARVGCLNSLGVGASLRGTGTASVLGDSLTLRCTDLPASATGLFFQGSGQINLGNGSVFGDGLRCVGGTVVRLAIKTATAGVMTYPAVGDAPISVRGNVTSNSVQHYQLWYRNSASFCTSSTFNLSEGVSVSWTP